MSTVGVIGIGRMGLPFALNLVAAGYDVAAHVEALIRHGVTPTAVLFDRRGPALGRVSPAVELVEADLAAEDGATHDPARLARALQRLAPPSC